MDKQQEQKAGRLASQGGDRRSKNQPNSDVRLLKDYGLTRLASQGRPNKPNSDVRFLKDLDDVKNGKNPENHQPDPESLQKTGEIPKSVSPTLCGLRSAKTGEIPKMHPILCGLPIILNSMEFLVEETPLISFEIQGG